MLQLIEISLICTGIHVCFLEGMVFYWLRKYVEFVIDVTILIPLYLWYIEKDMLSKTKKPWHVKAENLSNKITDWLIKPLYDCLPCMASFWTIVLMQKFDLKSILIVCGMNAIIASVLQFFANSKLPE